jgi:hypothetical protein
MPDQTTEQRDTFWAYLVNALISNPRTQAQIGTLVRTVLVAFGSSWAATHGDALNLLAGVLLAIAAFIWGLYQKWCVDRKIKSMEATKP